MTKHISHTRSQLEHLRADLGRLTAVISDLVDHQVKGTEEVGEALEKKVESSVEWVEEHVKDRPAQSIGIAVGVGFLLGVMAMRRH